MAQAQERPRIITEIQVRVDCNGCVQKIKKALRGINGISDVYIDLPRQKLTIVGWADPERIIKAVKKARKNATIYSHSEVQEPPSQPSDSAPPDGEAPPPPDDSNPPVDQSQPPQPEPPKDQPPPPNPPEPRKDLPPPPPENPAPPPENPPTNEPPPQPVHPNEAQHHQHNTVEEVHVIHHHPPDHSNRNRPGYGPGYESGPPGYNRAYDRGHGHGPPDYSQGYGPEHSPDHPRYSQRYGPGYNPGPPGYSQGYGPSYSSRPPGYSQGYDEPSYNPGPPDHSQGYEPSYNPGPPSHSRSHGYGEDWSGRLEPNYRPERPQPIQVTHSYNQYRPAPYVTQYGYVQSPPRYTPYARTEVIQSPPRYTPYASTESNYYYNNGDYQSNDNSNGYMASMLSEENPNACTIS